MNRASEFTVVRSSWQRGDANESMLLTTDGRMCCMGFYAEACGIPRLNLLGSMCIRDAFGGPEQREELEGLERDVVFGGKRRQSVDLAISENIYSLNDRSDITDETREKMIAALLRERGVTVHFVD